MTLDELKASFQEQIDSGATEKFFYELEIGGPETTDGVVTLIHHSVLDTFLSVANTFIFIGKNNTPNGIVPRFKAKLAE